MKITEGGLTWETPESIDKLLREEDRTRFEAYAKELLEMTEGMLVANTETFFLMPRKHLSTL